MSKNMNLLKPDIRDGHFKGTNDNERYRILHIPADDWDDRLEEDIRAGAVQYGACRECAGDNHFRFVIIQCDTEEEGLNAITYIRGARGFGGDADDEDDPVEDDGDYGWFEFDNNLPVISMNEIAAYEKETSEDVNNQFLFQEAKKKEKSNPYWLSYNGDVIITDVCMTDDFGNIALRNYDLNAFSNPFMDSTGSKWKWHEYFDRFMEDPDATVFYVLVRDRGLKELFEEHKQDDTDDEFDDFGMYRCNFDEDYSLCSLVLKYTAETVVIDAKKEQKEKYYTGLFKNWLEEYGYTLEKRFPVRKLLKGICMMDPAPSQTMDRILRFIRHKYPDVKVLERSLFTQTGVLKNVFDYKNEEKKRQNHELTMDDLVGMKDIKKQFNDIIRSIKFSRKRQEKGLPMLDYRNIFLLIGAPGTAKTTMANILGRMMRQEKLLGGTRFGSFSGAQLKAEYVGQTAHKVHSIFENHDIIIIDEAYSLTASDHGGMDTYSQEALGQLAIELEEHGTDRLVFFAGYGGNDVSEKNNKMREFLDANPGIKSRINGTIVFPSYSAKQMVEIVKGIAGRYGYIFEDGALDGLEGYYAKRICDERFGNGREARSFVDNCQMTLASRIMNIPPNKQTRKMMQLITKEDVDMTIKRLSESDDNQTGKKVIYGFA